MEKILPTILIIIDIMAAIPYGMMGNWRKLVYWLAAAAITFVVTY
jgi:hypothetical protein